MKSLTFQALLVSTLFLNLFCLFCCESHGRDRFLEDNDTIHTSAGEGNAEKAEALFVFGDSYADTGNHNPYNQTENQLWRPPYGLSWPGYPAGRYSSGKIQTDYWAEILGLPSPVPYELLRSHDCVSSWERIRRGVNFAVGGSGIFHSYGYITVSQQVKQFRKLIASSRPFDSHKFARSIVLISTANNDYLYFLDSRNGSIEGIVGMVEPLVSGMAETVKQLYELGFRNFVLSNIAAFGCLAQIGRTSCDSKYDEVITLHTRLLIHSVSQLTSDLNGSSIIIPDLFSAYNRIFSNPLHYGVEELFRPCCAAIGRVDGCAEVNKKGQALFEVCGNEDRKFFWDGRHPTHRGWHILMSLYCYPENLTGFVYGAPGVIDWVQSLGFIAHNISLLGHI